jgi:UDP-N-acetylenolpyruvoylglucosamine reductase
VVLKLDDAFAFVEAPRKQDDGRVCLVAGAAAVLARLSAVAADRGLSGLEFACGIPGTVGGGVIMNAGAHGVCLAAVLSRIQVATAVGVAWWDAASLPWGYRWCGLSDDAVVVAAEILLREDDPDAVRARQHGFLRARGRSQPRGVRTFGSTFKNPTGDAAGRLLDAAGLKGVRRGGAEVSSVHANFITNSGDATAADVVSLMRMMWEAVRHQFGVELEPEVHHLGVAP